MNLANGVAVAAEEAGKPNTIGALDPEGDQPSIWADVGKTERERVLVAGDRCGDEELGEPEPNPSSSTATCSSL